MVTLVCYTEGYKLVWAKTFPCWQDAWEFFRDFRVEAGYEVEFVR
jgi:hypothetical protein